jgi:hypothetical protein
VARTIAVRVTHAGKTGISAAKRKKDVIGCNSFGRSGV